MKRKIMDNEQLIMDNVQLPDGWEMKELKDLVNIRTGKLNANAMIEGGQYPFFTCSREIFSIDKYAFDCEAILLAGNNASGDFNVKHYKGKFNAYQRTYVITVNEKHKVLYGYLNHQLLNHLKKFKEQSVGANTKFLKLGMIQGMKIPLPPLPEQKRIVAILDRAFEAIDQAKANAEQNLNNAKELFESYLQSVFEEKGSDWEEKKLNEITEVKDGTHDSPKYVKEGIPFVTQKNIKSNGFSLIDTKFITKTDHDKFYKRSNVAFGDILISMIGANRGMAAIVDIKRTFSIKNVGLIKYSENYITNFLLYFLRSGIAKDYVQNNSKGSAQGFIGLGKLRNFIIPFPPLETQKQIVQQLDELQAETKKLETIYQQKIDNLEELKKSVLQKAFNGEL